MTTLKDFKHFDPLKNNKELIPDAAGVYMIVLKKNCKLPKVDCEYCCKKVLEKEVIYVQESLRPCPKFKTGSK